MLAVLPSQIPKMADDDKSSSDSFLPFGYNFNPNDGPVQDAPEPPPGAPLLTDQDSLLLSTFFEDMTSDQYSMPSFGEGLNFSNAWLDLPPQFMGTATSFGQQPGSLDAAPPAGHSGHHAMQSEPADYLRTMSMSHMMPPPPPPQHASSSRQHQLPHQTHQTHHQPHHLQHSPLRHQHAAHHSDEVLNAAATLLNNGSNAHHGQGGDFGVSRRPMGPPVGHLRHQPLEDFQEDGRKSLLKNQAHEDGMPDWMYTGQGRRPAEIPTGFQFGSDANFNAVQPYAPTASGETVESMHREQLKFLEGLEVAKSAANSRAPSPPHAPANTHAEEKQQAASLPPPPPTPPVKREEDSEAPPRKRRKSKNAKERPQFEDEDEKPAYEGKGKGRKSKATPATADDQSAEATEDSPPAAGGKRRKAGSSANGVKPPRENLSEEQKRSNHIKSEQKRRTLIKEGFDDLSELIPGLKQGGFSKSAMLSIAGDWLQELLDGNEALEKQLAELQGA